MSKSTAKDHTQTIWRMRLCSALRAAFACAIVGVTTLHGPKPLVAYLKFPAFSYVIVIIILSNTTTLGHALSGCWHAFYATIQVVPLAMLGRWLVSPSERVELPVGLAAFVAAVASFLVTLPESTHLTAKRIALGQIALICTEIVVISNKTSHGFMNPLHIGASAILGSMACLLASLLPFPGLAHNKVKKLCELYAENASERMYIYLKAFNAKDNKIKTELVLQAKATAEIGTKLLQNIKTLQEGIPWERPWSLYSENNNLINVENRLQNIEVAIRAIENTLTDFPSSPDQIFDQEKLEQLSVFVSTQLRNRIQKIEQFSPFEPPLESNLPTQQQKSESSCFVFSCIDMLLNGKDENPENVRQIFKFQIPKIDLSSALKCSFALGLAVLLGVTLERDNARWAGLTVAISFAMGPRPIFTTANTRAQGTALGSVYALIFCFLFRQPDLRLLALLPWIVFSTFLKHSKMYGQTGGISAAIGASVILGRKNYGPPNEFAIGRLTAVFVGLFCLVIVEIVFQRARSATLAKSQLRQTLVSLGELIKETRVYRKNEFISKIRGLGESVKTLESMIDDAESEPGFWYMPFRGRCYKRVVGCLYNVVCVLYVSMYNLENGVEVRKEFEERLGWELEELEGIVNLSLEKVSLIGSSRTADCGGGDGGDDVEAGKLEKMNGLISEDEKEIRAIGFCIGSLRKEIEEIEVCIKEIVRWDNHSSC
ncbi:hypothetical protein CASFOL_027663 [Castilleja foliolosa]|uniref:Integral membrane bound transporter domain-containing protein n=1 Tax=Castilleja foliolosa TaxID=1961234 RepID=A0ABD3CGB8_9LAMI